ncbi:MAG: helix-turn-helix domain-containing protein [Bacteroidales bacterium]|jgi:transcriptional regulator with XRE-family HTH domain|nr:helix-turn-helix domain-containing protein [Bacteroidales bacterium]
MSVSKNLGRRKIIGDLLKEFRESRGLTLYQMAKESGTIVSSQAGIVEKGETNYTIDTFFDYIEAAGLYIYFAEKENSTDEPHDFDDIIAKMLGN